MKNTIRETQRVKRRKKKQQSDHRDNVDMLACIKQAYSKNGNRFSKMLKNGRSVESRK